MKAKAWLAGALAVLVLFYWVHRRPNSPPGTPVPAPAGGGVLRIMAQAVDSLDPIHSRNYWESAIVLQLFDGLVRLDEHLAVAPAIAREWRISFDGTTYTFQLRRDVRFHHGRRSRPRILSIPSPGWSIRGGRQWTRNITPG